MGMPEAIAARRLTESWAPLSHEQKIAFQEFAQACEAGLHAFNEVSDTNNFEPIELYTMLVGADIVKILATMDPTTSRALRELFWVLINRVGE
jgi:hypothetical protein